ncbi:hypothetical protein AWM68_07785 [Fictibacillus phosphorivorans]|uniref:Uncharacterized protein n=1 Tax=Fictibacillus phosphorivorans TaxID=1221500 RepID=A0A163R6C7_9BACL|nr:hypothetical protein [Fictibacillus phosphorivorans]KZE66261.1 hypothetical protein AWM68_07785 [Fictibacillus phosphorivorans]
MNDGTIFYWFMWMGWVITTFLIKRSSVRNYSVLILLTGITLSDTFIAFSLGNINAAFLFFLCIGLVYLIKHTEQLFFYVTKSFIAATCYVSLELFALYDPVKLLFDKKYMIVIILASLLVLLTKTYKELFFLPIIGLFIGDTVFQFLIYRLSAKIEIGSLYVMDLLASTSMILLFMVVLVDMFKNLKRTPNNKVTSAKQI